MSDRNNIIRMAREACGPDVEDTLQDGHMLMLEIGEMSRFAELVIADFLQRTGQYLTNDASREAVIADAVAEEREACAAVIPSKSPGGGPLLQAAYDLGVAETQAAIRARGRHD